MTNIISEARRNAQKIDKSVISKEALQELKKATLWLKDKFIVYLKPSAMRMVQARLCG